jgi:hypothetical protein
MDLALPNSKSNNATQLNTRVLPVFIAKLTLVKNARGSAPSALAHRRTILKGL